jgi:HEAT repeats
MRRMHVSVLGALALMTAASPALPAGPATTVYFVPRYYNPYLPPSYFYRLYGPLPGDGIPILPPSPTVFPTGAVPLQPFGVPVTGAATGWPQRVGVSNVGGQVALIPQAGTTPASGGEIDKALQLLSSAREHDRMEAAITLGRNKVEKAIEPLQNTLAKDTSPRVREAAARGLGLIGSPNSLKALQTAAQADDDRDVRHSAQFAAETIRANAAR